jgi:hypothetical protein
MSGTQGAGAALARAAIEALRPIAGLTGIFDRHPLQASSPYAMVDAGLETDWSHKNGVGREVRLAVVLRDQGERPTRLHGLSGDAQAALTSLEVEAGWRLVTFNFVRSMVVAESTGQWVLTLQYRARMLSE